MRKDSIMRFLTFTFAAITIVTQLGCTGTFDCDCSGDDYKEINILHMNDVYLIRPNENGLGGLARVKTVLNEMKKKVDANTLFILSGDFISPSCMSNMYDGKQMIETLDATGLDFTTFGNHEFDKGLKILDARIAQSKFKWIVSNVFKNGKQYPGTTEYVIREVNGLKVGFFGILTDKTPTMAFVPEEITFEDIFKASRRVVNKLNDENVDLIIAITHIEMARDLELAAKIPDIDLVLGGHDHNRQYGRDGNALVLKCDSDAQTVAQVNVTISPNGKKVAMSKNITVNDDIDSDPKVAAIVKRYAEPFDKEYNKEIGETKVKLNAVAKTSRTRETGLGNLITDAMRNRANTDAAIMTGGGIRSNTVYPPGKLIKKNACSILPFGNQLAVVKVKGATLKKALNHGLSKHEEASGMFPQVSGITYTAKLSNDSKSRITSITVGGKPLDEGKEYTVAMPSYIRLGGDGYDMFKDAEVVDDPTPPLLLQVLIDEIAKQKVISPKVEGRITLVP